MSDYQKRTPERLIEILRSSDQNPRSWNQEAADTIAALLEQFAAQGKFFDEYRETTRQVGAAKLAAKDGEWLAIAGGFRAQLAKAEAQLASARKAIQDYLDGNYPHPRSFRPGKCPHGMFYFNECEECTDEHFTKALAALTDASRQPEHSQDAEHRADEGDQQ